MADTPESTIEPLSGAARDASTGAAPWIERLRLSHVRTYRHLSLEASPGPIVLTGENGAGKTNLLEALSLLAPGQGLRHAGLAEVTHVDESADAVAGTAARWAIAARIVTRDGAYEVGTGLKPASGPAGRAGRIVRIDGTTQASTARLADLVDIIWLTPPMDSLFRGPAAERRRFLDRLTLVYDRASRAQSSRFEQAMRERNRLLADGVRSAVRLDPLELIMAETGVAIAATRVEVVAQLQHKVLERQRARPGSPFPWCILAVDGWLEAALAAAPAIEVEDQYRVTLAGMRERDAAAGRTLHGPHRSDLVVRHGPKDIVAAQSSTGEQKALLVNIILAHAELMAERRGGAVPILLLDEIASHLDPARRAALFDEICRLGGQCWMTGTEEQAFSSLAHRALFLHVEGARVMARARPVHG